MRLAVIAMILCFMALSTSATGWAAAPPGQPLAVQFPKVEIPSASTLTTQTSGNVGGLPAVLSLKTGGTFAVSVSGLPALGEFSGTFACSGGGCALTLTNATGVFSKVTGTTLTVSSTGAVSGLLDTSFKNHGEWVSTVARAAAKLKAEDKLPNDLTVGELVSEAAKNQQEVHEASQPGNGSENGKGSGNGNGSGGGNGHGSGGGNGSGSGNGHGNGGGNGRTSH